LGSHVDWESVVKTGKSWAEMVAVVRGEIELMLSIAVLKSRSTKR
jgi:hypothetical protein